MTIPVVTPPSPKPTPPPIDFGKPSNHPYQPILRAKESQPTLVFRASRMIALPGQPIILTAELVGGDDTEKFYCPKVIWMWADGTESGVESDCEAYDARTEYQRRWSRGVALSQPGRYVLAVRLEKAGKIIARQVLELTGAGME